MTDRPTLQDVARKAGVSVKTVSRVVNREPFVSGQVREAVGRAIAELDDRPNVAARALASRAPSVIGLLSPQLISSYFRRFNSEVLGACRERGYHLAIEQLELDPATYVGQARRFIEEMRFDGLILAPGVADSVEVSELLKGAGIRYVAISPRHPSDADLVVTADEQQGERELAELFWNLGHRRFGVAKPPVFWRFTRGQAFVHALIELGASPNAITEYPFDWRVPGLEGGRRMAIDVLAAKHRPTALFAASDELAAGAIGLCLTHGVQVPGDISIAGFDDDQIAQAIWPPLTTIRLPLEAMIDRAIDMLIGTEKAKPTMQVVCPVELLVRELVAAKSGRPTGSGKAS